MQDFNRPNHESVLRNLEFLFKNYPQSQFTLNSLSDRYGFNIHNCLLDLERKKFITRCKVDINGKPVTHWQYNDYHTNDHIPYRPLQIRFNGTDGTNYKRNVSIKNETRTESNKELTNSYWRKFPDRPEFKGKIECDSVPSHNRQFIFAPKSNLNVNSPEFKPMSLQGAETFQVPQEVKMFSMENRKMKLSPDSQFVPAQQFKGDFFGKVKTKGDQSPKHILPALMTAMTKNPVSVLYEFCQPRGITCDFKVVEMDGPSHKPRFSTAVFLNGKQYEIAVAANKKEGKRKVADAAIRSLISDGHFTESAQMSIKSDPINSHQIIDSDDFITEPEFAISGKEKFGNRHQIYDSMVSLIYEKLAEIIDKLNPDDSLSLAGRKVVAGIVMHNEKYDHLEVVTLATGNRCVTGDKMSLQGRIVNDSHAEIVARRSFLYFLYKQLDQHISESSKSLDLFEEINEPSIASVKKRFKIRDHIKFHLYISTAPCGDGALFCSKESLEKRHKTFVVDSLNHEPLYENMTQGLLRTKIEGGEGTIPVQNSTDCNQIQTLDGILHGERLRTMSCSDKIARWNYLGIQGALLESFVQPIYLKSLMLGNLFHAGHLSRAVCCRLEKFIISPLTGKCTVNHPDLVGVYVGELHREIDKSNELSINWCYGEAVELVDGVTGELSMKLHSGPAMSRLSKASLFCEFHKLYKKMKYSLSVLPYSYREVKLLSRLYDDRKKTLYLRFHGAKYGSWICKPVEQSEFVNQLSLM